MRRSPFVSLLAVGPMLLLLAACTPASQLGSPPTPSTLAERHPLLTPEFQTIAATAIGGLTTRSLDDRANRIHAVIPQVEGQPELNALVSTFADAQIADYQTAIPTGSANQGFLSISWSPLGSSASLVGFLLSSETSPGASAASVEKTVWYDITDKRQLTLRDIVTPEGMDAVMGSIIQQLRSHAVNSGLAQVKKVLLDGEPSIGFGADGQLVVGFDSYQVADGSRGAPRFTIDAELPSILTPMGQAVRTAAQAPERLDAPIPSPTPSTRSVDCNDEKCVALTFDDGPSIGTTPRLLDILKDERVRATFFVLGSQVQAHPQIAARAVKEGHELGSHSWSHPQLTLLTPDAILTEVEKTGAAIRSATGAVPVIFRPPYGARNATVDDILASAGYAEVLWSVDTLDWKTRDSTATIDAAAKAKPGAIVLMHDIHATTVDAVPGVIAALRAQGYVFVTVSELVGAPKPGDQYFGTY